MSWSGRRIVCRLTMLALLLGSSPTLAQELTPRAYWPTPVGTELLFLGYAYQTGDIITNPALPITDVDSRINRFAVGYQKTFGFWGRTSNLRFEVPWADGVTRGLSEVVPARREVSGLGDASATLSVNLMGAPAMDARQFQTFRADPRPILAASLKVMAPTGQYDEARVINNGANRWAARARIGYIHPFPDKWLFELAVGTWFFGENDEFLGRTLEQDPLTAVDVSLIHRFGPGFWGSLDATYYFGGRTEIEGVGQADFQRNSRLGVTFAYPFHRRHVIKGSYSVGVSTNSGGDWDTLGLTWIYRLE